MSSLSFSLSGERVSRFECGRFFSLSQRKDDSRMRSEPTEDLTLSSSIGTGMRDNQTIHPHSKIPCKTSNTYCTTHTTCSPIQSLVSASHSHTHSESEFPHSRQEASLNRVFIANDSLCIRVGVPIRRGDFLEHRSVSCDLLHCRHRRRTVLRTSFGKRAGCVLSTLVLFLE